MNTTKSGDLAEKLVKIKRQRNELLQAAELIIIENIPIINAGEESNGVAQLDKVVEKIKGEQKEQVIANANLIAAAPELLEATESIIEQFIKDEGIISHKKKKIVKLKDIILKAKGVNKNE